LLDSWLLSKNACCMVLICCLCSDDGWSSCEEESLQTPLDSIDPYVLLADTLAAMQAHNPVRHQALVTGSDPGVQAALQGLLALSVEKRQKQLSRQG